MINFPATYLPREFCELMKRDLTWKQDAVPLIMQTLEGAPHLKMLLEKNLGELIRKESLKNLVSSLGWKNIRDRLACTYLYYAKFGQYPDLPSYSNLQLVDEILKMELMLEPNMSEQNSRAFMCLFYMKLAHLEQARVHEKSVAFPFISLMDLPMYFSRMKSRTKNMDWVILMVGHFHHYLGKEKLLPLMNKANPTYKEIYAQLGEGQRRLMISNFLTYSYAINDNKLYTKAFMD